MVNFTNYQFSFNGGPSTSQNCCNYFKLILFFMNFYLFPFNNYIYLTSQYFSNEICLNEVSGSNFYSNKLFLIWMRRLFAVYSQLFKVSSITPFGPLLHQPTAYFPMLTLFSFVTTHPSEFKTLLFLESNSSLFNGETQKPVLITSKSKLSLY